MQRAILLIAEEHGEAVKAVVDVTRLIMRGPTVFDEPASKEQIEEGIRHVTEEVTQTAAMCLLMLQNLKNGRF